MSNRGWTYILLVCIAAVIVVLALITNAWQS